MAIVFLPNTAASLATAQVGGLGATAGTNPAAGFDTQFGVVGARNFYYRTASTISESGFAYEHSSAITTPDYLVLAGAYKMLVEEGCQLTIGRGDGGGLYQDITLFNPLSVSDLTGYKKQDLITPFDSGSYNHKHGIVFSTVSGVASSFQFSSLFISNAFSFDQEPQTGSVTVQQREAEFVPRYSSLTYKTEAQIQMTFTQVTQAKCEAFKAIRNIYDWPLFIYDTTGDVFPHELEHVVLAAYDERRVNSDDYDVTLIFQRLKHYD